MVEAVDPARLPRAQKNKAEIEAIRCVDRNFIPGMPAEAREKAYRGWKRAVERSRAWEESDESKD